MSNDFETAARELCGYAFLCGVRAPVIYALLGGVREIETAWLDGYGIFPHYFSDYPADLQAVFIERRHKEREIYEGCYAMAETPEMRVFGSLVAITRIDRATLENWHGIGVDWFASRTVEVMTASSATRAAHAFVLLPQHPHGPFIPTERQARGLRPLDSLDVSVRLAKQFRTQTETAWRERAARHAR